MKNPGTLFTDETGAKYIAYQKEQHADFSNINKVLVHYFDADFKPTPGANGLPKKGLKGIDKLHQIGFVD